MAVYARGVGGHDAERVQPEPGSDEEKRLQALADDPASGWRRLDEGEPARPARSRAKKAGEGS